MHLSTIFFIAAFASNTLLVKPTKLFAPQVSGVDAHWPSAAKNGFGTSTSLQSKIWFTLTNGTMTEVFYPTLDQPNTQSLRFVVCTPQRCQDEGEDMHHSLRVLDSRSLTFQQTNTTSGFTITKTYTTDPQRPTVLIDVSIQSTAASPALFVYYDPSLKNSGMHDSAWSSNEALLASEGNVASALISSSGFENVRSAFARQDDNLHQLDSFEPAQPDSRVENGNVIQVGKLRPSHKFTIALSFGSTPAQALTAAQSSLRKGFSACRNEYESGWHAYLASLNLFKTRHSAQLNMAAMVLKALEDKTYRGAIIASPSTPWGGGPNANEPTLSGYHAVWSRDLYHTATALAAIGDRAAANRALDYLFKVQQRVDGSFPQNSWVDGRPIGGGSQMDQAALPIVLAFQLSRTDKATWRKYLKPAAEFVVSHGPVTGQDRWEEKPGYSPATLAAEIAGLVCAAEVARVHGDHSSAIRYLKKADEWEQKVDSWTVTTNGPLSDVPYFLRLTEQGNPNQANEMDINSGGGRYDHRQIVDVGFLELIRLGIRSPVDPVILKSLAVVDATIKVETPVGPGWYRYNHDAYGERPDGGPYDGRTGVGRLWTLLTGERGEYELASGQTARARVMLATLAGFANDGLMIPEQVWDRNVGDKSLFSIGTGTGSATPLAWSMAQFIRLAVNINSGRNTETPQIVAARYSRYSRRKK
jgi:glucoamylase